VSVLSEEEEKFKFALSQIDKRLMNLEIAIGEIQEKLKKREDEDLREKIEEIEDLVMLDVLGQIELKKFIEETRKKLEDVGKIGVDVERIAEEVKKRIGVGDDIKRLEERVRVLENEVLKKIADEVADLRNEMNKEIRDLRDRIMGIGETKSEIDLKFLSSRLKTLKENVDYLMNRKTELEMKIEEMRKAISRLSGISEGEKIDLLLRKIEELEKRIERIKGETKGPIVIE